MPVALKEDAEAVEGEEVVDLADVAGVFCDHAGQAAGGNDAGLVAEFGEDALDDAVDEACVAVVQARLQMADGVGAYDFGGALDVDAAETGGAGEERFGAEPEAGSDGSAEIFAFLGDDFEFGGGAEVDDDAGAAVALNGGNAVADAVGAELGGVVDEGGHAGLDAGLDEERVEIEVGFADLA